MFILSSKRVLAFMLLCTVTALGDASVDSAIKRLSNVEEFAFGPVGYAGSTSKGETDFKFLLSQPRFAAVAAFEKLYATGNPQGKMYALSGIKKLNPKRFNELLASSRAARDEVRVMRGCIVSHEALRDVAREIDGGKFRF